MGAVGFSSNSLKKKKEKAVFSVQYVYIAKLYTYKYLHLFNTNMEAFM